MKKNIQYVLLLTVSILLLNERIFSQTVTNYVFSPSSSTFTAISGGTNPTLEPGGNVDDGYYINIPIGFNFYYNSALYTSLSASTNGFICLGQNIANTQSQINNLTTGTSPTSPRPIIAALWDDISLSATTDLTYQTSGTSPSRVFTIQYLNVKWQYNGNAAISFQIKLYEADSKIEFYYSTLAGALLNPSASIGITNAGTGSNNFLSITSTGNNPFDTSLTTETTTLNTKPANGQKYAFIPKYGLPAAPTAITFTAVTPTAMTLNWTDNTSNETYYKVFISSDNLNFTLINTVNSTTALSTGTAYNYSVTGLTMGATYYYRVLTGNEGSASTNYVSASQATQAGVLSGTKTICPTGCDYTTVGLAASDIRAQGVNGSLLLELDATYNPTIETYPINFGNLLTTSTNTVTIRPKSNVTSIINFIWYGSNSQTFDFNNTKYLTIDGRKGGTGTASFITISNFNSNGTAVRFINDACNNTLKYCSISGATSNTSLGVVTFSTTTGTLGNSGNTIQNCNIKDSISNPLCAVYSLGNGSYPNINNSIFNCVISDYFNSSNPAYGIYLTTGTDQWTISNNHFFQTSPRSLSFNIAGAVFANSGASYTVTGNYIGGSTTFCGGTAMYYDGSGTVNLISLNLPTNNICNIQNNVMQNISLNVTGTPNSFVNMANGAFDVSGNTIGNTTSTNNIRITSTATDVLFSPILLNGGTSYGNINIASNVIGGISVGGTGTVQFRGINATVAVPALTISNNVIGSLTTNNSISDSTNRFLYGISATLTSANNTISGNILSNLSMLNNSNTNQICGIYINSTGAFTVQGNRVRNLLTQSTNTTAGLTTAIVGIMQNASGSNQVCSGNVVNGLFSTNTTLAMSVTGIYYSGTTSGTNIVSRNTIHGIVSLSTAASILTGLYNGASGTSVYNNMIRLGLDTSGADMNANLSIAGINDAGSSNNYYHNSIYIGGSSVDLGSNFTAAFYNSLNTSSGTRNMVNNIFDNARSNNLGSGKNYAVYFTSTTIAGLVTNYNILYSPGVGGTIGRFNAIDYSTLTSWRVAMVNDFNSAYGNPNFASPLNASSTMSLKVQSPTPAEGSGYLISGINDDNEGDTRASLTPTDIGADAGNYTGVDIFTPTITFTALTNTSSLANRIITATIADVGTGVRNGGSLQPRIWYRRSLPTVSSWYNTPGILTSGTVYNGTWSFTIDYGLIGGVVTVNNQYQYYIVAQDSASTPNLFYNPLAGASHSNVLNQITPPTTPASYIIVNGLPTSINVGTGQTYTTLTGAGGLFAAVNAGALSGNTTVTIVSDLTEPGTNALSNVGMGGYTMNIISDNIQHTISGSVASGWGMVSINGAIGVTIDGGITRTLVFRNSSGITPTTLTPVLWIYNGNNDTIRNCVIESNNSSAGYGEITISNSSPVNPCAGIVISNNIVRPAGNNPSNPSAVGILISASSGNISNSVIGGIPGFTGGNIISDFTSYGIYVNNAGNNITIGNTTDSLSGNQIYQTIARASYYSIYINSGNNHVISNNRIYSSPGITHTGTGIGIYVWNYLNNLTINNNSIGGSASNRSGAAFSISANYYGILFYGGSIVTSTISNNVISNISTAGAFTFTAIYNAAGNVTMSGNIIGGSAYTSNAFDNINVSQDFYGIRQASNSNLTANNNVISNITNNGTGLTTGVSIEAGIASVTGNTIRNFLVNNTGYTGADYSCNGIRVSTSTSGNIITDNTIFNLTNASNTASASVGGIAVTSAVNSSFVLRNRIYNLNATSLNLGVNSPIIWGIYATSTGSIVYANNQISISGSTANTMPRIRGIELATSGGTNNFYYNSIYIGGVAYGANSTRAFLRNTTGSAILELKNNILFNERTGGGTTHYAMTSTSVTNFFDDNNLFVTIAANLPVEYPAGTAITLAAWNVVSGNPLYNIGNTTAQLSSVQLFPNLANGDLSSTACKVSNAGTPVSITTDFNNNARSATTPDIGSTEFTTATGTPTLTQQLVAPAGVCASGGNITATILATGFNLTYQWQIDNGTGWNNVVNNATFTGATTNSLLITNPTTSYNANRIRNIITGTCSPVILTDSVSLSVTPVITNNTISSSQIICFGSAPAQLTGSAPAGGSGFFTIIWLNSTTSVSTGYYNASGAPSGYNFQPNSLTSQTWFRRYVQSGACVDSSASILISIDPPTVKGAVTGGTAVCSGSTSGTLTLSGNTGAVQKWQSAISPYTSWTDITNTATTYTSGALTQATAFRAVVKSGTCASANSDSTIVTISPATVKGSVSGGSSICSGSTSGTLTLSGNTGAVLKWQYAVSPFTSWTDISNTATTYTSGALTQTTAFRSVVQSGACAVLNSDSTIVTVIPPSGKGTLTGNTPICNGSTSSLSLSGQTGSVVRWEYAVSPFTSWTTVSNTTTSLTTSALTQVTAYRTVVQNGSCASVNTDSFVVSILSNGTWVGTTSTAWNIASNWCGGIPTSTSNVTINPGSPNSPVINTAAVVNNITINNGAQLSFSGTGNSLDVRGGLVVNGAFTTISGTVIYGNSSPQSIAAIAYEGLTMNGGSIKTIGGNITVSGILTLTNGSIQLGLNSLTIASTGSISGGSSTSFVISDTSGKLIQNNIGTSGRTGTIVFPVGMSATSYTPISISNTGTADNFSVNVINGVYPAYSAVFGTPSTSAYTTSAVGKTWYINEAVAGGSNASVTLQWNAADELSGFNRSNCRVCIYSGSLAGSWIWGPNGSATGTNPYSLTLAGITSFTPSTGKGQFAIGYNSTPVPVTFFDFNARFDGKYSLLNWTTASEINNDHFEVERSADNTLFEVIGKVISNGNSMDVNRYALTDQDAIRFAIDRDLKVIYYRIKQVDHDGQQTLSRTENVNMKTVSGDLHFDVNPNPFVDQIAIQIHQKETGNILVQVFDVAGKLVFETNRTNEFVESTITLEELSVLRSGIYYLRVSNSTDMKIMKVIKLN